MARVSKSKTKKKEECKQEEKQKKEPVKIIHRKNFGIVEKNIAKLLDRNELEPNENDWFC